MRCIYNSKYNAHTDPIFIKLGLHKFNDLLNINQACFVHKFAYDKLPSSFNDFFEKLPSFERNLSLRLPKISNNQLKIFPSYYLPLLWNSLPLETKRIISVSKFKKTYAKSLLSNYNKECNKINCYSCKNL